LRIIIAAGATVISLASAAGQGAPEPIPQISNTVFKNVQVMKGVPVDEFMDAMGMFSAALGYDCVSCHAPEISSNREAYAITTPAIQRARGMIAMTNALNRSFFSGEQRVSCFTCHRGQYRPDNVPSLALQYGEITVDPNAMVIAVDQGASVDRVFDGYLQALGGAQRLSTLTTLVARGTYTGFNTGGTELPLEIFAKAPDQRTMIIRTPEGDEVETYDGRNGWAARQSKPVPLMTLTGGNLAGARLDAIMSFPVGIRQAFSQWQMSSTTIDDRPIRIAQGTNSGQLPVNLYFDESGLLLRSVRWSRTPVGAVPTQTDYADYRNVDDGIKLPFRTTVTWTGGQNTIQLSEVRLNVQVDGTRFAKPAPFRAQ
jgi:hypothetical protein